MEGRREHETEAGFLHTRCDVLGIQIYRNLERLQNVGAAAAAGVPLASIAVPASGVIATLGGLSILLGYRVRIGAWLLVLFLIPVTVMMHNFWALKDPMMAQIQMVMFMKNLALIGGAFLISQFGAGPWSLDSRREQRLR